MAEPDVPRLFTPEQVAEALDITRDEVLRHVRQGKLKCTRINRVTYKFTQADIDEWLAARRVEMPVPQPREPMPKVKPVKLPKRLRG